MSVVTWLHLQRHGWGRTSVALGIMKIHRWPWALSRLWGPTARLLSISVLTVMLPAACNIRGWEVVQVSFSWVSSTTAPREFTQTLHRLSTRCQSALGIFAVVCSETL